MTTFQENLKQCTLCVFENPEDFIRHFELNRYRIVTHSDIHAFYMSGSRCSVQLTCDDETQPEQGIDTSRVIEWLRSYGVEV